MRTIVASVAVTLAFSVVGGEVAAQTGEPATAAAEPTAKSPNKSKKVCRTVVTSGTRFSQRQCRSQQDWDKDAENAQRYLEEGQMYGYRRDGENTTESGVTRPPR